MEIVLPLPGKRRIIWNFSGAIPAERFRLLSEVLPPAIPSLAEPEVVAQISVREGKRPEIDRNDPTVIRYGEGFSAFHSESGIELFFNPASQPDANQLTLQLERTVLYGILPLVLSGEALIFHGALLNGKAGGVLLTGCSGAGKSTCARRAAPLWEALADDMVLVTRDGDKYYAQGLPTWSQFLPGRPAEGRKRVDWNRIIPLTAVFRLVHAERVDEVVDLSHLDRIGAVLSGACDFDGVWGVERSGCRQRLAVAEMDFSLKMERAVPVAGLNHTLNGDFPKKLDEYLCTRQMS